MKIPFELINPNTGSSISFEIPQNWDEVTVGEFVEIKKLLIAGIKPEGSNLLPVFSGIPADVWRKTKTEAVGGAIAAVFELWTSPPPEFLKLPTPKSISINEKEIGTKAGLGKYSFGIIEAMTQKITNWITQDGVKADSLDELIIFAAEVIALFSYEEYSGGEWDEEKSKDIIPEIQDLPAVIGIPLAVFFLSIALESLTNGITLLNQKRKRIRRRK
jgi:hypothetical protein